MDFKMKTTAFKVFASCVAIVCLASSTVSRASPVQKLDSATSENPIVMKRYPSITQIKNLISIYRIKNRSYDPEVEWWLKKDQKANSGSSSVESKQFHFYSLPPSNEIEDSHQSNKNQSSEQSNSVQNSKESNLAQNSVESNSAQNSEQSNSVQESPESNEDHDSEQFKDDSKPLPRVLPIPESYESKETEESSKSRENKDNNNKKDR